MKEIVMLTSADACADPVHGGKDQPYVEQLPEYIYFGEALAAHGMRLNITKPFYFLDLSSHAWVFDNGCFRPSRFSDVDVLFERIVNDEASYDRVKEAVQGRGINVVNHPRLTDICADKYLTSQTFVHAIESIKVSQGHHEIEDIVEEYGKAIIKPRYGAKGEDIFMIDDPVQIPNQIDNSYIVQPFIDSSCGIPELGIEGMFDLRLLVSGERIFEAYVRKPVTGGFLSNCAQGGSAIIVSHEEIPVDFMETASEVMTYFKKFGRNLYSIDMMRDAMYGGVKVVELNSKPGFTSTEPGIGPEDKLLMDEYVRLLKDEAH